MSVPKMRGLKEAVNELHQQDGGSALSLYALRSLVTTGAIPCVRIGRRVLISMDVLYEYLNSPPAPEPDTKQELRKIFRIGG